MTGDWQKFKGLPGTEGTLRAAAGEGRQAGPVRGRAWPPVGSDDGNDRDHPAEEAPTEAEASPEADRARERRRVVSVLEDALEHLVRGIVDNEDEVSVELTTGRRGRTLQVRVHPDDLGKVIGRGGRTATALRTVMCAVGGRGIRVDVVDTDR